jgi:hypothetical protein
MVGGLIMTMISSCLVVDKFSRKRCPICQMPFMEEEEEEEATPNQFGDR